MRTLDLAASPPSLPVADAQNLKQIIAAATATAADNDGGRRRRARSLRRARAFRRSSGRRAHDGGDIVRDSGGDGGDGYQLHAEHNYESLAAHERSPEDDGYRRGKADDARARLNERH